MAESEQKKDNQILTIRFPVAIIGKLDRYVRRFQKEFPGISFQRTDAIRLFVERGLKNQTVPAAQPSEPAKPEKPTRTGKPKVKKETKGRRLAKRKLGAGKPKAKKTKR